MVGVLRLALVLSVAMAVSFVASSHAETKTVTLLDRGEPFGGMSFHDGVLWVGKSRKNFNSHYTLEAYQADKKVGSLSLPHTAAFISAYDNDSVIVVGSGYKPRLSHYTIATFSNGKIRARTVAIPVNAWARQWIGTLGGREYFTDPGGNPNDNTTDYSLSAQTFFSFSSGRPRYLRARLSLPLGGVQVGKRFYVYNHKAIGNYRSQLYELNPQTHKLTPLFQNYRNGIGGITKLNGSLIALSEENANQVLVIDTKTNKTVATVPVSGGPRAVSHFGKCVLVASRDSRTVSAIDVSDVKNTKVVGELSVDLPTSEFRTLDNVVGNPKTGEIYARSNFACNVFAGECPEDWNRVVTWETKKTESFGSLCSSKKF